MTAAWKSSLKPASFRGATFGVVDTETTIGRRIVFHEYPLRDDPYAEDLGRKGREYTVNAFVIGDNYFSARDALMKALEDSSSGSLIHPTLGSLTVVPKDCRVHFKNTEGGIEYFQLTFVEAGSNSFPSSKGNTQSLTNSMADLGISNFSSVFSQLFSTINFPDFVSGSAISTLIGSGSNVSGVTTSKSSTFLGILQNIIQSKSISDSPLTLGQIPIGSTPIPDPTQAINFSDMQNSLIDFENDVPTLVSTPAPTPTSSNVGGIATTQAPLPLATAMTDLIVALLNIYPNNPAQAIVALIQLFNTFGADLVFIPLTTTSRLQQSINRQMLIDLVRNTALAQMAVATSNMTWASRQDALATLSSIVDLMEPQLIYLGDNAYDNSFKALNNIRTAMIKDVNTRAATLKNIKYVQTQYAIPALVFAYKQYGDASQESDVVARNKIRNPVFIPPQSLVEVIL